MSVPLRRNPAALPDAELEVMALLWQRGAVTSGDVRKALAPHRKMGIAAAQTLLLRLEAKGLVRREKIPGRNAYLYTPTRQPEPTYRNLVRKMLDRIFGGSTVKLVSSLFATHRPTAREIQQLEELIEKAKKRSGKD